MSAERAAHANFLSPDVRSLFRPLSGDWQGQIPEPSVPDSPV